MFDTSGDVYSYIAFAIVSLHVLYPLPSNIMHPKCDKRNKKVSNISLPKYIKYINKNLLNTFTLIELY